MKHILHISDLHFWTITYNPFYLLNKRALGNLNLIFRRSHYIRQERTNSFLDLVGEIKPDAVLVSGDLTTTALIREYEMASNFLARVESLCPALFVIPGNHDYYTFESCRQKRFETYSGHYATRLDSTACCQLDAGVSLLHIPTVRANIISSRGFISKEQIEATRAMVENSPEGQLIALAHYPYLDKTPEYHTKLSRRLSGASRLRNALGDSGHSILYLAGHVHTFSHRRDPLYKSLTQVTSPALFYDKKRQAGGFTEIWMDKDGFQIFPWTYTEGWIREKESLPESW